MRTEEVAATVAGLVDAVPEDLDDRDDIAALVGSTRRIRSWLDAFEVRCARRARELAEAGRAEPPESLLTNTGGHSSKGSTTVTDRERACTSATTFEAALAAGEITAAHVDAMAAAARGLDDELAARFWSRERSLLSIARHSTVDAFTRKVRRVVRQLRADAARRGSEADELELQRRHSKVSRWVDDVTGMHHTHLELDPVRDAELWSAIDTQLGRLRQADGTGDQPFAQLQVDAVVAAVSAGEPTRRVPQITVLVDLDTLRSDLHEAGVCERSDGVPLPVASVRRLCCEAEVLPVVLDGQGCALDVGRSRRSATPSQRQALRAMYRGCARRGCTVPFDQCRIHHVRWWWEHHGPSDLDNLLPLCERHHHLVHEGGWNLTMTPDRVTTWIRPDGTVDDQGPSVDRAPHGVAATRRATGPSSAAPAGVG